MHEIIKEEDISKLTDRELADLSHVVRLLIVELDASICLLQSLNSELLDATSLVYRSPQVNEFMKLKDRRDENRQLLNAIRVERQRRVDQLSLALKNKLKP